MVCFLALISPSLFLLLILPHSPSLYEHLSVLGVLSHHHRRFHSLDCLQLCSHAVAPSSPFLFPISFSFLTTQSYLIFKFMFLLFYMPSFLCLFVCINDLLIFYIKFFILISISFSGCFHTFHLFTIHFHRYHQPHHFDHYLSNPQRHLTLPLELFLF